MTEEIKYNINYEYLDYYLARRDIPSGAKLVLWRLTRYLRGKRTCWPSQETIARQIGMSSRQVRKHIALWQKLDLIRVRRKAFSPEKGFLMSNEYDLEPILRVRKNKRGTQ